MGILEGKINQIVKLGKICIKFPKVKYPWDDIQFEYKILQDLYHQGIKNVPKVYMMVNIPNKPILFYRYIDGVPLTETLLVIKGKEIYESLERIHRFQGSRWGNCLLSSNSLEEYLYEFSEYIQTFLHKTSLGRHINEKFQLTKEFLELTETISYKKVPVLVHGDVKPGNVIISSHNQLYFIDWGRSRFFLREYEFVVPYLHGYKKFASALQSYFKSLNPENITLSIAYHLLDLITCIIYDSQNIPLKIILRYKRNMYKYWKGEF